MCDGVRGVGREGSLEQLLHRLKLLWAESQSLQGGLSVHTSVLAALRVPSSDSHRDKRFRRSDLINGRVRLEFHDRDRTCHPRA